MTHRKKEACRRGLSEWRNNAFCAQLKDRAMDSVLSIAVFAGGNSLGTFFAMKRA
jgi:hypothetical protein